MRRRLARDISNGKPTMHGLIFSVNSSIAASRAWSPARGGNIRAAHGYREAANDAAGQADKHVIDGFM
jgi:hypothetical protein